MTLVSENIRYLRKLNGLTQEQFSRKINIKRSLLGAYEEGRANPNQQNIQAIAKAFNTTVELLTRQDLRKLRETPNLSIPLGQSTRTSSNRSEGIPSSIRSDGALDPDDDDPFQHPDFPDIFAQPEPKTPEPQPLASVLNKYYRTQEETRPAPAPPVITSPVRPAAERAQAVAFQPVPADSSGRSPVDRLFGQPDENRPIASPLPAPSPGRRPPEPLTFNNVYEGSGAVAHANPSVQAIAPTIPVVMQGQYGEYIQRYQQTEFLQRLPAMHLPTLPEGHYRAFEAGDDFAFPSALLVGQFVRNWFDIADGKMYVLLTQRDRPDVPAISCRRVYNQVKVKGSLLLTADRADIPNREVVLKDVLEVWEVRAFVSQQLPPPAPSTDRLRQLVDELRFEVERL
ncbi:helix-turn-helix domain-containing protein [Spirosoma taeanense]|uniref:Helix-turn-helix domain-containing protein n=1 Tax=Spirosoma taeanense TaxID=2735870 RepID=A0A6M5Y7U2_9BACT|nr:helix-turn-helix transcriptional regulator [Spirosoma taeanense]QJW90407.1 helix-turn-helix domain-containing protein [Spirosoma taeanense]